MLVDMKKIVMRNAMSPMEAVGMLACPPEPDFSLRLTAT
jgi:hypothetical protein